MRGCLGTVELFCSRRRAYHSRPWKMADARPTFPLPQRYTQRKTEAVQPPDDRTYSAEVTVFQRNLPHHRSTRIVSLHTLDYDTTLFPFCQEEFLFFSQSFLCIFVHSDGVKKLYNMNGAALPAPFLYQPAISFIKWRINISTHNTPFSVFFNQQHFLLTHHNGRKTERYRQSLLRNCCNTFSTSLFFKYLDYSSFFNVCYCEGRSFLNNDFRMYTRP